ncbi:MAG: L-glutamate gamma-semialdehyde dehydrogenase [Planctomycetes bacterium]|nr:L-glutamate gamma-semialdehyde dehydrogenase [Planctomycetota bacterium]
MVAPFKNEPFSDFKRPEQRQAFEEALERVDEELGADYPVVIDGERITREATFETHDPSDPEVVVGRFSKADADDGRRAVEAAHAAFPAWSETPWADRAHLLFEMADRMRKDKHYYSAWMVREVGKTWPEADGDTAEAIDFCEYYGREALRYGKGHPVVQTEDHNEFFYVPLGVGVVIPPWNFPLAIPTGMATAALAAGNTVVLKPAELSATIGWKLFELLEAVGFPRGVVNFVPGSGRVAGQAMVEHPKTRFVSFTGSMEVGLRLAETCGKTMPGQRWIKRLVAEMGGKDGIVVDETADLDAAATAIVASAFGFQGQKCSACSRAIVVDAVYDALLAKVVERTKALKVGDAADPTVNVGPMTGAAQRDKTLEYCEIARQEGRIVAGGHAVGDKGYFVAPTVVADIKPDARLAQEEVFGPVLSFLRAKDWSDALAIANDTLYGLTGAVFSKDPRRLAEAKRRFYVGNLYLNRKCTGALVGAHPFGGYDMSGTCSKAGGPDYLGLFLQSKSVATRRI